MKIYAIAAVSLAVVGIGAAIVITNQKKRTNFQSAIRQVSQQFDDGVIDSTEAPGLAAAIESGRIHTSEFTYSPNRRSMESGT